MFAAILGIHIMVCAALIVVVLLQSGKGGGLAGAFGGAGGVGAVFGGQAAATFLTKATRYLAIGFMVTSLALAMTLRGTLGGRTVTEGLESRQPTAATTAGEVVTDEGAPEGMPAGTPGELPSDLPGEESQGETPAAASEGETGGEIPVVPEGQ